MLPFILVPIIFKKLSRTKSHVNFCVNSGSQQLDAKYAMREGPSTKTFQTELKTDSFSEILPQCATRLRVKTLLRVRT